MPSSENLTPNKGNLPPSSNLEGLTKRRISSYY